MLDPIWQAMAYVPTQQPPVAEVDNDALWRMMNAISQAMTEKVSP